MKMLIFYFFLSLSFYSFGKIHPTLPEPEKSNCNACHSSIFGKKNHKPLEESCFNCHNFKKEGEKLQIFLKKELPEICYDCHQDLKGFKDAKTVHQVYEDCSLCHNSHSSNFNFLLKAKSPDLCFECHDLKELKEKSHKGQPIEGGNCKNCHNPHFAPKEKLLLGSFAHLPFEEKSCESCHKKSITRNIRLITTPDKLCSSCHGGLDLVPKGSFIHRPFKDLECLKCHDPHISKEKGLLKEKERDLCLKCHKNIDLKGKLHPPLEEGCLGCHKSHYSLKEYLLIEEMYSDKNISSFCFYCHTIDENLKNKHRAENLDDINCAVCHNSHSSSQKFLLNEASLHEVFQNCENCHTKGIKVLKEEPELCFDCHDLKEKFSSFKFPHPVLEEGCLVCHTPHISKNKPLLKESSKKVCGICHNFDFPYEHNIISLKGCQICHFPHGSDREKFLKNSENELCLECHLFGKTTNLEKELGLDFPKIKLNDKRERGHPTIFHPVTGIYKNSKSVKMPMGKLELNCLSCHNPHGGKSKNLYPFDKENQNQLCALCHDK